MTHSMIEAWETERNVYGKWSLTGKEQEGLFRLKHHARFRAWMHPVGVLLPPVVNDNCSDAYSVSNSDGDKLSISWASLGVPR